MPDAAPTHPGPGPVADAVAGAAAEPDGRRARSERTRAAVLDSLIELIAVGEVPTSAEVAAAAGISERSLFRHFDSVEGLFDAVIDHMVDRLGPLAPPPTTDGTTAERLDALMAGRAELYETMTPLRRVAPVYAVRSERVAERMLETQRWLRSQVAEALAPELGGLAAADRREVLDAVDAILSWEAWDHLRRLGSSAVRTRRLVTHTASVLLAEVVSR